MSSIAGANGTTLFVRALDQLDATPLTGLGSPINPFVSPDGQWIGFADAGRTLKKVAITGGPAETLARLDGQFRGATWAPDGTIVFATTNAAAGLQRMPADDGEPSVLTRPDRARGEADHFWPEFLPGGQAVLFTITGDDGWTRPGADRRPRSPDRHADDADPGRQRRALRARSERHLVYGAAGALRAVAFDLARLAVVGTSGAGRAAGSDDGQRCGQCRGGG